MIPLDEKYIIQNLNYEFWWKKKLCYKGVI